MSRTTLTQIIRFVVLVLAQAWIFNNINFLGYINPYPYVIFILLYPLQNDRTLFLLICFALGLSVDIFSDSGGVNAAASLVAGYLRPTILRFSYKTAYEYHSIQIEKTSFIERLRYISLMVATHHLVLFSLEVFNISMTFYVLEKTLYSSIFTILLCVLFISLRQTK